MVASGCHRREVGLLRSHRSPGKEFTIRDGIVLKWAYARRHAHTLTLVRTTATVLRAARRPRHGAPGPRSRPPATLGHPRRPHVQPAHRGARQLDPERRG